MSCIDSLPAFSHIFLGFSAAGNHPNDSSDYRETVRSAFLRSVSDAFADRKAAQPSGRAAGRINLPLTHSRLPESFYRATSR